MGRRRKNGARYPSGKLKPNLDESGEPVHSLAKWKRQAKSVANAPAFFDHLATTIATLLDDGSTTLAPALPVPTPFVPIRIRIDADAARSNLNGRLG